MPLLRIVFPLAMFTTGIAGCCARATSGQVVAPSYQPKSSVIAGTETDRRIKHYDPAVSPGTASRLCCGRIALAPESKSMWLGLAAITLASGFSALAGTIQEA